MTFQQQMAHSERFNLETFSKKQTEVVSNNEIQPGQATIISHMNKGQGGLLDNYHRTLIFCQRFQVFLFPNLGSFKGSAEHERRMIF